MNYYDYLFKFILIGDSSKFSFLKLIDIFLKMLENQPFLCNSYTVDLKKTTNQQLEWNSDLNKLN